LALVYSHRFLDGNPTNTTLSAVVPAGYTWVIRDISGAFWAQTAPTPQVNFSRSGGAIFYVVVSNGAVEAFQWRGHQVLNAGETLSVQVVNGGCYFAISGYQLTD
jgi:hypothetical protein